PIAETLADEIEEARVQVAMAPRVVVDRLAVEPEHHGEDALRDGLPHQRLDGDALLGERALLAARLIAPLAAQALEIVVEGGEPLVQPVILVGSAQEPAPRRERAPIVVGAEVDVCGRHLLAVAQALHRGGEYARDAVVHAWSSEKTLAGHRRERHG